MHFSRFPTNLSISPFLLLIFKEIFFSCELKNCFFYAIKNMTGTKFSFTFFNASFSSKLSSLTRG